MKIILISIFILLTASVAVIGAENYVVDVNGNHCASLKVNGNCFEDANTFSQVQLSCTAFPNEVIIYET